MNSKFGRRSEGCGLAVPGVASHAHDIEDHEIDEDDEDGPDAGAGAAEKEGKDHDRADEEGAGDDEGFESGREFVEHGRVS